MRGRARFLVGLLALAAALVIVGGGSGFAAGGPAAAPRQASDPVGTGAPVTSPAGPVSDATVLIAGDIAGCGWTADTKTANLIKNVPGIVMTAGDNVYQTGSTYQYNHCYGPTWGQFLDRTRPVPGNHEWYTSGAAGYFKYFGSRAGPNKRGYYAFMAGSWRIYALSGDCSKVGGCHPGDPMYEWLKADLAANPTACIMAVWHEPRWTSGAVHHDSQPVGNLYRLLYAAGAELLVTGHNHQYERFAPMRPNGTVGADGIREFVVGTGGAPRYSFSSHIHAGSEVRNASTWGVLQLTLGAGTYAWKFLPVAGKTFTDQGSGTCH